MSELAYLTATDVLAQFRARSLSPVEYLEAIIARIESVEPKVGALADTYFDEALAQARTAEAKYARPGARIRPLEGLPLAIKDEMNVAGQRNTQGSLIFKDYIAQTTIPLAERVLAAGAIIHARTRTPEFSCVPFTHSKLWGVTHNPWNPAYDVGGSSGGAGAALASGMAPLAAGSDIGGSIRIPSSCCGVVGFKPPYGRVPSYAPFNLDHYSHDGPLARTVSDCALFENVIAGPHPHDVVSLRPKLTIPEKLGDVKGWKIALSVQLGNFPVDHDVRANTLAAAEAFRDAGAIVEEVELSWDHDAIMDTAGRHFAATFGPFVAKYAALHPDLITDYARKFASVNAGYAAPGEYVRGLEDEAALYAELGDILERNRLLICPTLALPALEAGKDYVDEPAVINGEAIGGLYPHLMTIPFNICSRCPVMSIPSGLSRDGVPTGLQIVGRTYDDVSVFRAGAVFERLTSIGHPAIA